MIICSKNACTGCYACYNVCPKRCINMELDEVGHLYPSIDEKLCIKCSLCQKSCPSINNVKFLRPMKAYAAWSSNEIDRKSSTSGGAASIFSRHYIKDNGVVFGAAVEKNITVNHIEVSNEEDLKKLKGSKYVHSKIGSTYKKAEIALRKGRQVLFIGTPCQIAGLKKILKKDYDKLLTVDIICHGVPSQKILNDYIVENIGDIEVNNISFRDVEGFNLTLKKNEKMVFKEKLNDSTYYLGFMKALFYRENCYSCIYAQENRVSDITIGDFWGLGEKEPFNYSKKNGVSVLLPNTEKGLNLIKMCSKDMFIEERSLEEAINGNDQLRAPSVRHKNYYLFKRLYSNGSLSLAVKKSLRKEIIRIKVKEFVLKYNILYKMVKVVKPNFH